MNDYYNESTQELLQSNYQPPVEMYEKPPKKINPIFVIIIVAAFIVLAVIIYFIINLLNSPERKIQGVWASDSAGEILYFDGSNVQVITYADHEVESVILGTFTLESGQNGKMILKANYSQVLIAGEVEDSALKRVEIDEEIKDNNLYLSNFHYFYDDGDTDTYSDSVEYRKLEGSFNEAIEQVVDNYDQFMSDYKIENSV